MWGLRGAWLSFLGSDGVRGLAGVREVPISLPGAP